LNKISRYTLDGSTGTLTKQGEVDADFQPTFIAAHPTRDLVYATAFCSDEVLAYSIDTTTGALTSLGSVAAGDGPASLTVSSNVVYVTNFNSNTVSVHEIGPAGALTLVQTMPTGAGPAGIGVDPTGRFAYVANHNQDKFTALSAFKIDASTGKLEATVPDAPFQTGRGPFAIAIHPTGSFIYITNKISNSVTAYRIDTTTGELTDVLGSAFVTEEGPKGVTIDPSGRFLYVGSGHVNKVSIHTIDSNGILQTPPSTVGAGEEPEGIVVDPTGKFVYAVNVVTKDISTYKIEPDGSLTEIFPRVLL
jgi:6-phosphogluconolactonase (cycloisomerase 2 family)